MRGKMLSVKVLPLILVMGFLFRAVGSTDASINITSTTEVFAVQYSIYDNHTEDEYRSYEEHLNVYSNGTATYLYDTPWRDLPASRIRQLSLSMVSELYVTLIDEGFDSLDYTYRDTGWSRTEVNHTECVRIEVPGEIRTVTFLGNSMMGITPNSYALLKNFMWLVDIGFPYFPDVALDIAVTEPVDHGPVADVTALLSNYGPWTLRDFAACNTSWPLFVVSANGTTVSDLQNGVIPACMIEIPPLAADDFGPWKWDRTGLSPGKYVIMSRAVLWDYESGSIASDLTWTPDDSQFEAEGDNHGLSLALLGIGIAIAVAAALPLALYIRRRGLNRRKGE